MPQPPPGLQRGGGFRDEQVAGNPRLCWFGREVVLRRNRQWAGTENEKPADTGLSSAAASVAAGPEPAPNRGDGRKKTNRERLVLE
jgi:hypothetical protein